MMSRCPSVVSMPTLAPLRSRSALVATVVPWTIRSVAASSARASVPSSAAKRPRPAITPIDGSSGVEADFAITTRPLLSTATRSVKVPPTSTPMRYMSAPPALPASRAGLPAHEAVFEVGGAGRGRPARRLAPAPAPRRDDVEDGPRRDRNADLLGLEDAPLAAGDHDIAVRQAVL